MKVKAGSNSYQPYNKNTNYMLQQEKIRLAETIREYWIEERRNVEIRTIGVATNWGINHMLQWDGGTTPSGQTRENIWLRIVDFCEEHSLDPILLVRALHYNAFKTPTPNQATGPYALARYQDYLSSKTQMELKVDITNNFEAEKACILSAVKRYVHYHNWNEQEAWQNTVSDSSEPLSPLFRYCVAKNQGWDNIAEKYFKQAKRQYVQHRQLYDEVWKEWLPSDLVK